MVSGCVRHPRRSKGMTRTLIAVSARRGAEAHGHGPLLLGLELTEALRVVALQEERLLEARLAEVLSTDVNELRRSATWPKTRHLHERCSIP